MMMKMLTMMMMMTMTMAVEKNQANTIKGKQYKSK